MERSDIAGQVERHVGRSYFTPLTTTNAPFPKPSRIVGSLGFRMVEPKLTANPSETQDRWREFTRKKNKKSVQAVRSVGRQCPLIRGEKFTSR